MSIAEKLTAIAENVQKVYDAGKAAGGGDASPNYLPYTTSLSFNAAVFPEDKRDVILHLSPLTSAVKSVNRWFGYTNATSLTVVGDTISTLHANYSFEGSADLKTIDLSQCGNGVIKLSESAENTFSGCKSLEQIIGELDCSGTVFANAFRTCTNLREIRITPLTIKSNLSFNVSPLLSNESIQSIIDGLADLTGTTAQTLTVHATVGAALTDEQKAAASAKNWTLVY